MKNFVIGTLFWLSTIYIISVLTWGIVLQPHHTQCLEGSTRCNPGAN